MTWFKKALNFVKEHAPPVLEGIIKLGEETVSGVGSFTKLTAEMVGAAEVNIEEGLGKGFRAIAGKSQFLKAHNTQEGPLKSSVSLQDLASMSKSAYEMGGGERTGYSTLFSKEVEDLSFTMYESEEDGHIVVSFRGTNSFANWQKRNLNFHKVDDGFGNQVHAGFKSAWDTLKPEVDKELFDHFGGSVFTNNVTFTGHSLGGAIAQMATAEYTNTQDIRLLDTVTFASPTVGDAGFNARIPAGHHMRVIDPRDSVPKVVQQLEPAFVEPASATRIVALGGRAARLNDKIKSDAIRFGINVAFDSGVALLLAYAPEALMGVGEAGELGVGLGGEEIIEGALALEEEAILSAQELVGVGQAAEEKAAAGTFVEAIGGGGGEIITHAERADISILFNAKARASIVKQLGSLDVRALTENTIRNAVGEVDLEATLAKAFAAAGVHEGVQNLLTPFITENISKDGDLDYEQLEFLMHNGWDYMYGAAVAHPVDTYINNINNRFGDNRINARDDMWQNYLKNLGDQGDGSKLVEFMTEEELRDFQENFAHAPAKDPSPIDRPDDGDKAPLPIEDPGDDDEFAPPLQEDDEDAEDDEDDEEEDDEEEEPAFGARGDTRIGFAPEHNLAGHEANEISGRPLHVLTEGQGRKDDGTRIFAVVTEEGDTLAYTGPAHPTSTTTLFGRWTGVAPFADDLPIKVSRQNAFGGQSFSALDTFSMAYLVNSYTNGYHNSDADAKYMKRITAAIDNGFISEAIDGEELKVARMILQEFKEKGHLIGAENTAMVSKGNVLTEIDRMSRGGGANLGDDVKGVPVAFSTGRRTSIASILATTKGTGIASDVMRRSSKRLKSGEVDDGNIMEEGSSTIDFNMNVLRNLGMDRDPVFSILANGAKQHALAYKTALNVEEELNDVIREAQAKKGGGTFSTGGPNSIFPNVLDQYTSRDINLSDERNMSGNAEHFKDMAVLEILKAVI